MDLDPEAPADLDELRAMVASARWSVLWLDVQARGTLRARSDGFRASGAQDGGGARDHVWLEIPGGSFRAVLVPGDGRPADQAFDRLARAASAPGGVEGIVRGRRAEAGDSPILELRAFVLREGQ